MTDPELIARLDELAARGGTADDMVLRAALVRLDELVRSAPRRTLPVRIAVVMGAGGGWYAWGESGQSGHDMCQEALAQIGDDPRICYIVTANVPVPETREIEGRIETATAASD